jgi:non-specific serine/threonine protein kinase
LHELVASSRLVTLTGVGGAGKTRLAVRLAAEMATCFHDGVVVVELAPLADSALVPQAVLQALGMSDLMGQVTEQMAVGAMGGMDVLLLLDNCEHLVGACAALVARVLRETSTVTIVATSREPLEAPGETIFALTPLRLPPVDVEPSCERLASYESVQLFAERARAARRGFALDETNVVTVARICRRLDGLPLALELAAARMWSMSAADILDHLDDRFALLRRERSHWPSRQQTLRATLEWSHNLLSEDERVCSAASRCSRAVGPLTMQCRLPPARR